MRQRKWYDLSRLDEPDFPRARGDWVVLAVVIAVLLPSCYVALVLVMSL